MVRNRLANGVPVSDKYETIWVVLLLLRLCSLGFAAAGLTTHMRCIKVFAWEQWVSAGLFVTYLIAAIGLAFNAGTGKEIGQAFHAYLTTTGALFFAINSATIWRRWKNAKQMTKVVAEILNAAGMPIEKYLYAKVILSGLTSSTFLLDLLLTPLSQTFEDEVI